MSRASHHLMAGKQLMSRPRTVLKFVAHSRTVLDIAYRYGWHPGARYTNLRDVKTVRRLGFLDIRWKDYDFTEHLKATKLTRPYITVAQDIVRSRDLAKVLDEACELAEWAQYVVIV